jgi:molybdopterin-guanine dinucleotide biosynthesis protein A
VSRPTTRGVVLAGGLSRRFAGGPKALATLDDDPLAVHVARALRAATGPPPAVAVRGPDQRTALADILGDAAFVEDDPGFEGPLAGVVGAARALSEPWLFVCGCDMPLLAPAAVGWLLDRAAGDAVVVTEDGVVQPTHALYRREAVCRVAPDLPRDGGVRALVGALDDVARHPVEAGAGVGMASSLANVNTRADLRALRERDG